MTGTLLPMTAMPGRRGSWLLYRFIVRQNVAVITTSTVIAVAGALLLWLLGGWSAQGAVAFAVLWLAVKFLGIAVVGVPLVRQWLPPDTSARDGE